MQEVTTTLCNEVTTLHNELEEVIKRHDAEVKVLTYKINVLEEENEQLQRRLRKNSVVISGVPKIQGEKDGFETLNRISRTLNLGITEDHVDNCHYIPTRNTAAKPSFVILFLQKRMKNTTIRKILKT